MIRYQHIDSKDNSLVKTIVRLTKDPQQRKDLHRALIFGEHLLIEAAKFELLEQVLVVADKLDKYAALLASLPASKVISVSREVMHKINCLDSPTDIAGLIKLVQPQLVAADYHRDCLVLENIQDPGNLGTILRAARASGVSNVILSANSVDSSNPKVLRASQGIQFGLKIVSEVNLSEFLQRYQGQVLALTPHATASLYQQNLASPSAFVLGNEGSGLSPQLLATIAQQVTIPMLGDAESLNLAMAASIALFEMSRQRLINN